MQLDVEGIGNRLRDRRKALGLTQKTVANQIGIGADVVSKQENEKLGVSSETLVAYAKIYKTSAEELAGADPGPHIFISGHGSMENVSALRNAQVHGLSQIPIALGRFLSDGRCNPLTDEEIAHLTRHLNDGNSPELDDLEVHLLAHRAERDRTKQSVETFKEAVLRTAKSRGMHEREMKTQTRELPVPAGARKKPELTR